MATTELQERDRSRIDDKYKWNLDEVFPNLAAWRTEKDRAAALAEPRSEYLWVAASVSPDDAVTLYPFKRIPDGANVLPAAGGEYSVRGYDIRSIGPTVPGSQIGAHRTE